MNVDEKRIDAAKKVIAPFVEGRPRVLGAGFEAIIMNDDKLVYKVFDEKPLFYGRILDQFKGRFDGCKRLIADMNYFTSCGKTVLTYPFEKSDEYRGGREDEIKEFLIESALRGIVFKDVKPRNFRVFEDGLKLIDYGHDAVPFSYKDFLFMAQRAFLSIDGWGNPNFKHLARKAITDWSLPELRGFREFFNDVYSRLLKAKEENMQPRLFVLPENLWIERCVSELSKDKELTIFEYLNGTCSEYADAFGIKDADVLGPTLLIAEGWTQPNNDVLKEIRRKMADGIEFSLIVANPFFDPEETNGSLTSYKRCLEDMGFMIKSMNESPPRPDENSEFYSRFILFKCVAFTPCGKDTTLMIKVCYQDAGTLEKCVKHIVSQLETPDRFLEKIVVVDRKEGDFLRGYSKPDVEKTLAVLNDLKGSQIIDEFYLSPVDKEEISCLNKKWFGADCDQTHCVRGIPVVPQIFGFEKCKGRYILQADCDVIIVRRDRAHRFLLDMKSALSDNENAISAGFNIAHPPDSAFKPYAGQYVPEVRICLLDKQRLLAFRPYPNEVIGGGLKLTWYRSVEVAQKERGLVSLRGGDPRTFYIHPQNSAKKDREFLLKVIEHAEMSEVPAIQHENVDLMGNPCDWTFPPKDSEFVFIVCGRNLTNRRFLRGWQSIADQTREDWSAVIVNDASENNLHEYISLITENNRKKVIYTNNPVRRGILANIHDAIREYCSNPHSVIVIMDMDDMLLSNDALEALRREYLFGADVVVGTALKTTSGILPFEPDFKDTRNERLGDVWIHLRSFRKYLFDAVKEDDFKLNGKWIDKFTELTYAVPIAEMARQPVHITWPIYLWQPGHKRDENHHTMNETIKAEVRNRPKYERLPDGCRNFRRVNPPGELLHKMAPECVTFIRHGEKEKFQFSTTEARRITERGQREATLWGKAISEKIDLFITSFVERTKETAWCIRSANNPDAKIISKWSMGGLGARNREKWEDIKKKHGFLNAINLWAEGKIPVDVMEPYGDALSRFLEDTVKTIEDERSVMPMIVTHDHMILILQRTFFGTIVRKIPYMGGFSISISEIKEKIKELRRLI